jgi:cellulose biosynthesis protein BcsQ
MPEQNKSYVIWNNKGGVGKSTITFHIASTYAEKNPDRNVVVIDMCPQANSSMMLLGGGRKAEARLQSLMGLETPRTIVGYITDTLIKGDVNVEEYLSKVNLENNQIPENLFLLAGDGNLELISPLLSTRANIEPLSKSDSPWIEVHTIIKKLTQRTLFERETTFFIDTNPSFAIYTQMAILGGERLIVPINADDSSIYAITGLFSLIWGSKKEHPVYGKYTFASRVDQHSLTRPKIAILVGNRFTQKLGAANAFKAVSQEAVRYMFTEFLENPNRFLDYEKVAKNHESFEEIYSIELRDFNSAGVVSANQGLPLSRMQNQRLYDVYDAKDIHVSNKQRKLCLEVIEILVSRL